MSTRHGLHHVAQKSSKTILPLNSENLRVLPVKSVNEKSCAPPFERAFVTVAGGFGSASEAAVLASLGASLAALAPATSISVSTVTVLGGRQMVSLHAWNVILTASFCLPA